MIEAEKITDLQEIRSRILAMDVDSDFMLCVNDDALLKSVRQMIYKDIHTIWPPQGRFTTRLLHDYEKYDEDDGLKRELWIYRIK